MVQTRWTYLNRHYNLLTEVEAMLLDGHFVLEHGARYGGGLFFNFNGTAGILRRRDDRRRGRVAARHAHRRLRPQLSRAAEGLEVRLHPRCRVPVGTAGRDARLPGAAIALGQGTDAGRDEAAADASCKADLPKRVKMEAIFHLTPNISYPLMIVVSALMLPVMIVRFYMGWMQMLFIDLPLIVASFWSISAFYVLAQRELYPKTWKRGIFFIPVLMAAGVALTISNTRAVLEALFGVQTAFARTPKYAIGGTQP